MFRCRKLSHVCPLRSFLWVACQSLPFGCNVSLIRGCHDDSRRVSNWQVLVKPSICATILYSICDQLVRWNYSNTNTFTNPDTSFSRTRPSYPPLLLYLALWTCEKHQKHNVVVNEVQKCLKPGSVFTLAHHIVPLVEVGQFPIRANIIHTIATRR